ncbi:CPBP family intramembrane glutamic endopeptidase [Solimicrobium silvestre]|uniref:CAAX protease self-immunity n=1 Tax=Solimicrobium silvestre TaxID=2099400 RepID=A0A2S9H404_9BURK|nr:CPBP family intramembrane glutamic endopeptidase [Solimicrobium silvestre]PRC94715.1 CAAX protease self-immunity [Solimicrobium silvestre]
MSVLSDARKAKVRNIFIGPDGLRAGWSVLLFIVIYASIGAATALILNLIVQMMHLPKTSQNIATLKDTYIGQSILVALVVIATAVMARIEKKSFGSYGLGGQRGVPNFFIGVVAGFICLSILVGLLYVSGHLVFDGIALQGISIFSYASLWFGDFMLVAINEEMMIRGYLQNALFRGIGPWPSILVLSLLFTAMHMGNSGENIIGLIGVFVAGIFFCLLRWLSGSLWLGIGFHGAWNWSQSYLYGAPDSGVTAQGHLMITHAVGDIKMSGGTAGPEGSLFANPVVFIGMMVLLWIIRRTKSPTIR